MKGTANMADILVKLKKRWGVERRVSSSIYQMRAARWLSYALFGWVIASANAAVPLREVPAPTFGELKPVGVVAAPPKPKPLDQLVYKDGDRVRGRFVSREGDMILFQSERFGLLRAPAASAEVILAEPPAASGVAEAAKEDAPKSDVAVERWPFSPHALAEGLKSFFGSWHGRFAMSAEMMEDSREQNSGTVEAVLQRKWADDEVQITGRYDYATVDEARTSTDMIRGSGVWRHDFPGKLFAVYRPTLEWNRAYYRLGVPADYVLLQQELGVGVSIVDKDSRKLRVGISENLFDTWLTTTDTHITQTVESVFGEVEARLPWRIVITDRGVWYYSIADQSKGWENRFEINKKLTETLTMGLRHEVRRNNPDVRSADYQRLRVLFGLDF
jgi:hypothetical protein